ncbi:MAG: M67 family metallopeptidase [Candidatus Freyarchaeota archaeon]|nr:M67 family metallopeptidase [Candidatus Jordarchaeia archaeon]MBS7268196.1 M67 family metallopeptidase [Candidatus Jordarchaeia archaeon]MBS7279455.1 M67 family metallopeptidase [Candidatus Jordarchaeia archaeon]
MEEVLLPIPKIQKIILNNDHIKMMLEETRKTYPKEACGVILGLFEGDTAKAQEVVFTKNVAESSVSFAIDVEELYRILVRAESEGKDMVGIFHSHPTIAKPSSADKPFMELNPVVWVIFGTLSDRIEMAAYQWFENTIHHVEIVVENKGNKELSF